jgi:hypothetical protein
VIALPPLDFALVLVITLVVTLLGAWLIPWLTMRLIMNARFKSGKHEATNYAGKTVSYGLGLVWLVWAASTTVIFVVVNFLINPALGNTLMTGGSVTFYGYVQTAVDLYMRSSTLLLIAVPLALACFVFGWFDDRFGARGDGGFRGHLKALFRGKLSTGMVKVFGIGSVALLAGTFLASMGRSTVFFSGEQNALLNDIIFVVLATMAIALSANLINLFDLRPARAGKVYIISLVEVFILGAVVSLVMVLSFAAQSNANEITSVHVADPFGSFMYWDFWPSLIMMLWLLGPILAIWRFDAGEKAMLGDAGANPAGALLGLFAVMSLGVLLPVYVVAAFALNLMSEKVSFSALIERTSFLKKLDMWGRPKT